MQGILLVVLSLFSLSAFATDFSWDWNGQTFWSPVTAEDDSTFENSRPVKIQNIDLIESLPSMWKRLLPNVDSLAEISQEEPVQQSPLAPLVEEVRVQIFPHWGPYSTPQGREAAVDQVHFQSTGTCTARSVSDAEMLKPLGALPKSRLTITYDDVARPLEVTCTAVAMLERPGMDRNFSYRGRFLVRRSPENFAKNRVVQVINILSLEDYLKGVVPSEMPASWHEEALKSQAVAARTYAVNDIFASRRREKKSAYDLEDTIFSQAYLGFGNEHPRATAALDATSGQILVHTDEVVRAYFSADSGGHTERAPHEWPGAPDSPYLVDRPEFYNLANVKSEWTKTVSYSDVLQRLVRKGLVSPASRVLGIEVTQRYASTRAQIVRFRMAKSDPVEMRGAAFRSALGLRSSMIQLKSLNSAEVQIDGLGFGHGVGMNQWGAHILASKNAWTANEILEFYYPGSKLKLISELNSSPVQSDD